MNDTRRKAIKKAVEAYLEKTRSAKEELTGILTDIREAEEGSYDNLPENIQYGEKGDAMQDAINALDDLISELDEDDEEIFSEVYATCGVA